MNAWLVLAGAVVGAAAGVAGQVVTARLGSSNDRRRLAIEAGFREWEQLIALGKQHQRGFKMYPPVLFVHFNYEILRLMDEGNFTPIDYQLVADQRDEMRKSIDEDSLRRRRRDGATEMEDVD